MDPRDAEQCFGHKYSSFDPEQMIITIPWCDDDGEEIELEYPARWEVCGLCDGRGKHVNPSIDCNGLTREDFDNDPDFEEDYFSGTYNVDCYRCNGRTTEPVVDERKCSKEQIDLLHKIEEAEELDRQERAYEMRMGF